MSTNLNGHERPVNKMAALSFAKGTEFKSQWKINPNATLFENRPKTDLFPGPKEHDLSGFKYSRLLVVGYISGKTNCSGSLWVVRCVCGQYEARRSKSLKNQDPNKVYRCSVCERFAESKRAQEYRALGYNKFDEIGKY